MIDYTFFQEHTLRLFGLDIYILPSFPTICLLQFLFAGYGGDFRVWYFFRVLLCWFIPFLPDTRFTFCVIVLRWVLVSAKGFVFVFSAYLILRIHVVLHVPLQVPFPISDNICMAPL